MARCKTRTLAKADSHASAMETCKACEHGESPAYVELPPSWEYESPLEIQPPVRTAKQQQVEKQNRNPVLLFEAEDFDPADYEDVPLDEIEVETSRGEPLERPPKHRPPPPPIELPPTTREVAVHLPVPQLEQERPKETLIKAREVLTPTPPQKIAAKLPLYKPPKDDGAQSTVTPTIREILNIALKRIPAAKGGPSVMGWSKLQTALLCPRAFYWRWVAGLVPTLKSPEREYEDVRGESKLQLEAATIGGLFHTTLALHRMTGGYYTWLALYATRVHYPRLTLAVKNYVERYQAHRGPADAREWDMRAVEWESRYYYPARRVGGRSRRLCVSSRHDALYHRLRAGEARMPVNTPAKSIYIDELKTAAPSNVPSTLAGYRVDAQILLHFGTAKFGLAAGHDGVVRDKSTEEIFGRVQGVTLDWLVKTERFEPAKHLQRQTYMISDDQIQQFLSSLGDFYYTEVADRLFSTHCDDLATWPQHWLCRGIFFPRWVCPYRRFCDIAQKSIILDKEYVQVGKLDKETLELPKKIGKGPKGRRKKKAATEVEGK